ncbi:MAG TPA: heme-binding protein [Gemmatimonadales bacterium]|nr:heme-binding protein [Gemmatimonadales bacterium]
MSRRSVHRCSRLLIRAAAGAGVVAAAACSDDDVTNPPSFTPNAVVTADQLKTALQGAVGSNSKVDNGGLGLNMWATVVDRSGVVVAVVFTGTTEGDQWPGSRIISAQKANTANNFSLSAPGSLALSTANLYSAVQPGGSLFGLQDANPINEDAAYGGNAADYGTTRDYMVGKRIGGTNVFGGGFALYDANGNIVGGVGVSGDTSCADHVIGWKVRHALNLDNVPAGVSATGDDNIIYDIDANGKSAGGFGHPHCLDAATESTIAANLPVAFPVGPQ